MSLNARADAITSREDFVAFVDSLRQDLTVHPDEWQNATLASFLEALSAWVHDMDGYYENHRLPVPTTPSWKNLGEMLLAAKYYE